MSENFRIEPRPYYNTKTRTCESPTGDPVNSSPEKPVSSPAKQTLFRPELDAFAGYSSKPSRPEKIGSSSFFTGVFSPSFLACSSPDKNELFTDPPNTGGTRSSGGTSGTAGSTAGRGGTSASGGTSGLGGNSGGAGDAGEAGTGGVGPGTGDILGEAQAFGNVPCGTGSFISDLDYDMGVCAGGTEGSQLFGWEDNTENSFATLNSLGFAPDQILEGSDGTVYITTHGNPAEGQGPGMAVVNASLSEPVQHLEFPTNSFSTPRLNSKGEPVSQLSPTMPKGIAEFGDFAFVATSNLRIPNPADTTKNYFDPGTVQVYQKSTGTWLRPLETTGFNPTSVMILNNRLYVINTGVESTSGEASTPSSMDVFNPLTHARIEAEGLELGPVAAGLGGEITVTPGGDTVLLPTGDNSGRLIAVDLNNGSVREIPLPITGDKIFLNSVVLDPVKPWVYVGNLNDGKVYAMNWETGQHLHTRLVDETAAKMATEPEKFLGLSDGLFAGGSVFLGLGPRVVRVPVNVNP
jgi:hypothetical protein